MEAASIAARNSAAYSRVGSREPFVMHSQGVNETLLDKLASLETSMGLPRGLVTATPRPSMGAAHSVFYSNTDNLAATVGEYVDKVAVLRLAYFEKSGDLASIRGKTDMYSLGAQRQKGAP